MFINFASEDHFNRVSRSDEEGGDSNAVQAGNAANNDPGFKSTGVKPSSKAEAAAKKAKVTVAEAAMDSTRKGKEGKKLDGKKAVQLEEEQHDMRAVAHRLAAAPSKPKPRPLAARAMAPSLGESNPNMDEAADRLANVTARPNAQGTSNGKGKQRAVASHPAASPAPALQPTAVASLLPLPVCPGTSPLQEVALSSRVARPSSNLAASSPQYFPEIDMKWPKALSELATLLPPPPKELGLLDEVEEDVEEELLMLQLSDSPEAYKMWFGIQRNIQINLRNSAATFGTSNEARNFVTYRGKALSEYYMLWKKEMGGPLRGKPTGVECGAEDSSLSCRDMSGGSNWAEQVDFDELSPLSRT